MFYGSLTLTSWIQPKGALMVVVETFYPRRRHRRRVARVIDDVIEVFDGEVIQVGPALPWAMNTKGKIPRSFAR